MIEEEVPEGDPKECIKHYSAAVKSVKDGLTEEQLAEVEAKVEEWNTKGPDEEQQQKYCCFSFEDNSH